MSADNDTGTSDSSGQSTYDRKQDTRTKEQKKKGSTFESFKDGKSQGIDYGVKDSVENYKESQFKKNNQDNKIKIFNKSNEVNRKFYADKVLTGKNKEKFRSLNPTQQEAQYKSYMNKRLSGETDAYQNVNPNFGRDGNNSVKTVTQVEKESKDEMEKETPKTTEEEEAAYKKRKGLVGSRSLFSTGGQRGFFN